MAKAVYVHVPFCEQICHYCDFNKVFLKGQPISDYLAAFSQEVKTTVQNRPPEMIESIYIGGGTPTALSSEQLKFLLQIINESFVPQSNQLEYTVEVNPGSVDERKLTVLREAGVNRLSIGVQAFQNTLLKRIGRIHQVDDVFSTIEFARTLGFENLSLDLMFGLPEQTEEMFQETLEVALSLPVEHFSAYSLKVEEKTVFHQLQRKGRLSLPPEDVEVRMFEMLISEMNRNGYHQYEISNFAKKGYESKHNLTYWNNDGYYGLGAGAHGYIEGIRHVNVGPINHYIKLIKEAGLPYLEKHKVTIVEKMEEEMFMGLRKLEGISKKRFFERFQVSIEDVFGQEIRELKQRGLLKEINGCVALTQDGIFLGNEVFEKFIGVVEEIER